MSILTSVHVSKGKVTIRLDENEDIETFINLLSVNGYQFIEKQDERDLVFSKIIELPDHSLYEPTVAKELETLVFGKYIELSVNYIDFDGKIIHK